MIPLISSLGEPRLAHEDETSQKNCLECHAGTKQWERPWVKMGSVKNSLGVYYDPPSEESKMDEDKREVTCKSGYCVRQLLRRRPICDERLFLLCDGLSILLHVVWDFDSRAPSLAPGPPN